jgi:hypothetical protein
VKVNGLTTGCVNAHRLVPVLGGVEVTMVRCDDRSLDTQGGEFTNGSGEVVDNSVHDRACLEAALSEEVDLLRTHDHPVSVAEFLGEPCLTQRLYVAESEVDGCRHQRGKVFLASVEVRQRGVADPRNESAATLENLEVGGSARHERRHSRWRDARKNTNRRSDRDFGMGCQAVGEVSAHFVAHSVDQKVRNAPGQGPNHVIVDSCLWELPIHCPSGSFERRHESRGQLAYHDVIPVSNRSNGPIVGVILQLREPRFELPLGAVDGMPRGGVALDVLRDVSWQAAQLSFY